VEVEGVQPPPIQGASEPVLLMIVKKAAVFRVLDPSQLRENFLPLSHNVAVLKEGLEIAVLQNDGLDTPFTVWLAEVANAAASWYLGEGAVLSPGSRMAEATVGKDYRRLPGTTLEENTTRLIRIARDVQIVFFGRENLKKLVEWAELALEHGKQNSSSVRFDHLVDRLVDL
jgi:hypothetical protein